MYIYIFPKNSSLCLIANSNRLAFASRYPDMVRALKANRLKAVSHDHIFHTLLSLASIRSEVVRNGLNLASPDARETPAPLQPEVLAEWLAAPAPPQPLP